MNEAMGKVRDYIALIMTIAILIMVGFKVVMPDRIWDIYMMVVAFFFGSKVDSMPKADLEPKKVISDEIKPITEVKV